MILYRPVGIEELALIFKSGMTVFPPRLPEQPIFYPVTNFRYASQIARDWNTTSGSKAGYVTTFTVDDDYVSRFERKIVGGHEHEELWVPAEELEEFNRNIKCLIEVDAGFFGEGFTGIIPGQFGLRGKDATGQFICLRAIADYSGMDFSCETYAQQQSIYCHYPFWCQHDFTADGVSVDQRDDLIDRLEKRWEMSDIPFSLPLLNHKNG
ncbi:MAG: hypothetical protein P1V20_31480 [Verrucomicrobiales bacterium]|nr:hypothetical protein [Verrucomicrobiales bacterium]